MMNQVIPQVIDAVIYARYSGGSNQRDCSIEQQVADCETFARYNNLRVIKVYADHAMSGTSDKRPQFQQMLKDSARGKFQYVICWKTDRFARSRYDSVTYKYRLRKNNVSVLYAKESIPGGPEGIFLESVLEGGAEYYSANLSQNVRRGMMYNAQQCKINSGNIPFGYCKGADGKYALNPGQAEIVREIFSSFLSGASFSEIANDLNSRGIKTARGRTWNKHSFHAMMKNEIYTGVYHYADVRIEGGTPLIISSDQFLEVQRLLETKRNPQGRARDKAEYMLTGKLKCAHCDSYMVGISGTSKNGQLHHYYGCMGHIKEKICHKKNVSRDWIERLVVKSTLDYVLQDDVIEWMADCVISYQQRESNSAVLESLIAESAAVDKSIANVMAAIEAGIITPTTKSRLMELESRSAQLRHQIETEKRNISCLTRDQVIFWFRQFQNGNPESKEFRRKVIDTFIQTVYLSDDTLKIIFPYSGKHSSTTLTLSTLPPSECSQTVNDGLPKASYTNTTTIHFIGSAFVLEMSLPPVK